MKITMTNTRQGSPDGVTINDYEDGKDYIVPARLGELFVKAGSAIEIPDPDAPVTGTPGPRLPQISADHWAGIFVGIGQAIQAYTLKVHDDASVWQGDERMADNLPALVLQLAETIEAPEWLRAFPAERDASDQDLVASLNAKIDTLTADLERLQADAVAAAAAAPAPTVTNVLNAGTPTVGDEPAAVGDAGTTPASNPPAPPAPNTGRRQRS